MLVNDRIQKTKLSPASSLPLCSKTIVSRVSVDRKLVATDARDDKNGTKGWSQPSQLSLNFVQNIIFHLFSPKMLSSRIRKLSEIVTTDGEKEKFEEMT